jgi:Flp pilus assembly CpaE family ATPase
VGRADSTAEDRLRAMGIEFLVPDDAEPSVVGSVISEAVAVAEGGTMRLRLTRTFGDPATATSQVIPLSGTAPASAQPTSRGSIVAVWGPTGAPGRTTVAVALADELARLGCASLLVDADVYGGVIAAVLGLLDESPGLAAACRQAASTRLDAAALVGLCWQLTPTLRVLTGIPRAQRWPELRATAVGSVLGAARGMADFTVVDCGFALESDEELSYDTLAPRRNGATLAVLDAADVVLAVGAADPIGLQRLIHGLAELRDAEVAVPIWIVLNKVRRGVVPGDPPVELSAALDRFAGRQPAALLPYDPEPLDAALAVGKTLGEANPNSALRKATAELAAALAGVPHAKHRRRRG